MSDLPTLCPACLAELPDDYPYDHVAIDRVLSGNTCLFAAMTHEERVEVVLVGLDRGMSLSAIEAATGWPYYHLQRLVPDDHAQSLVRQQEALETQVRALWGQDLPDDEIGLRIGRSPTKVQKTRRRLGLASKFGPGGRRRKAVAA